MKLVPCNENEFRMKMRKSNNFKILSEFIDSGLKCARLEGWSQVNATCCAESLRASIKRYRMKQIFVMVRRGEVYLARENIV